MVFKKLTTLSAGQTSATFNATFDATFEKMLHTFDMGLKFSCNIINNICCVNQKKFFEHGHQQDKMLCCGCFAFDLAIWRSIWCSKKQNVAHNVVWVWQMNATTQHRRFFVATSCNKMNMFILLHRCCNMLHGHATSCNMGSKRVQHLMQHCCIKCCIRLTSALAGYVIQATEELLKFTVE